MTGLTRNDYKRVLDVQDACNLSGVVHSFADIIEKVWEEARQHGMARTG